MFISLGISTEVILMSGKDILKSISLCNSERVTDDICAVRRLVKECFESVKLYMIVTEICHNSTVLCMVCMTYLQKEKGIDYADRGDEKSSKMGTGITGRNDFVSDDQ